jgi:N-terminal half of MaoC dehydratase
VIASDAMNPAAEGIEYPPVPFEVDPVRLDAFRRAVGVSTGIPPTYLTVAEFQVFPRVIDDPVLELDFARVVHATQEYAFDRPLREGETLTIHSRIGSIRIRGATAFVTVETALRDTVGAIVATARSTLIERGET